jgi:hypothetical protein
MKHKITLNRAWELLNLAVAVIIDGNILVYPSFSDLNGESDNEWLYLSWEDEGNEFGAKFFENCDPEIQDGFLILTDTDGEKNKFTLLEPMKLVS